MLNRIVLRAVAVSACLFASGASAATVGWTLTVSGDENVPTVTLSNDSVSDLIERFTLSIGDENFNFDYVSNITAPSGGTVTLISPDDADQGPETKLVDLEFTDFDPGETFSGEFDFDQDGVNSVENFRTILFNNGTGMNAVATVFFSGGDIVALTLPDQADSAQESYTFSATGSGASVVPLPAAAPLLAVALAGLGFAARRRRG